MKEESCHSCITEQATDGNQNIYEGKIYYTYLKLHPLISTRVLVSSRGNVLGIAEQINTLPPMEEICAFWKGRGLMERRGEVAILSVGRCGCFLQWPNLYCTFESPQDLH